MIPTGDFLAHVGDWTSLSPRRAARPPARLGRRLGRRFRRARAAEGASRATRRRCASSRPTAIRPRCSRSCARCPATPAPRSTATSTSSASVRSTASTSPSPVRSSSPTRCCRRSGSRSKVATSPAPTSHELTAAGPRPGAGGAPRGVRRDARRGAPHVSPARRAWRLQRHLGVGAHAPRRARGRSTRVARAATSPTRCTSSTPASTRCAPWSRAPVARRTTSSAARAEYRATHTSKDAPPFLGDPPQPPPDPSGLPPGHRPHHAAMGIALDLLFGSSDAEHAQDVLRGLAASPGIYEGPARLDRAARRSSAASSRATCSSRRRPPRRSTSCCRCSAPSSPTTAACCRTRRSSRVSTASPAWSAPARPPNASPTAPACASTAPPARGARCIGSCSDLVPLARGERHLDLRLEGGRPRRRDPRRAAGAARCRAARAPWSRRLPPRTRRRSSGCCRRCATCPRRSRCARRPSTRTAKDASFAGQHLTLLNVPSVDDVPSALREIWWSANSDSAITYRQRVGLFTRPSVGVVVQSLLEPDVAGVMFTQNPVTGADESLIEAAWGLGEAVVAGLVIPDTYRVARDGDVLERTAGLKRIAIRSLPDGGTYEEDIDAVRAEALHPRRRPARATRPARAALRGGLRQRARHRVGDLRRHALPAAVPRRHHVDVEVGGHRSDRRRRHERSGRRCCPRCRCSRACPTTRSNSSRRCSRRAGSRRARR